MSVIGALHDVVLGRKEQKQEGSYTCYLFEKGTDKILKKVGEECTEVVIAAKNGEKDEIVSEICDLTYHLLVLIANQGIPLDAIEKELENRRLKIGNLKNFHQVDKSS